MFRCALDTRKLELFRKSVVFCRKLMRIRENLSSHNSKRNEARNSLGTGYLHPDKASDFLSFLKCGTNAFNSQKLLAASTFGMLAGTQKRAVLLAPIPYPPRQLTLIRPPAYTNSLRRGPISPRASYCPRQDGHSTRRSIGSSSGIYELFSTSIGSLRPLSAL